MKTIGKIVSYSLLGLILLAIGGCAGLFNQTAEAPAEESDYGCAYFYFLWGRQAELSMQFAEALEAYQKALICDPEADYILRKIPPLLLRLDEGEKAVQMLQETLEKDPGDVADRLLLARIYIGLGEYEEAAHQYRTIHEQNPSETRALLLLSELYLNLRMIDQAEHMLQEVLKVNPDSYETHVLLARIYSGTKRYEQALTEYDESLRLNWSIDLLMEKADVYRMQEKYDKVVSLYREILEKDRNNERAALALINQLLDMDLEDEALVELKRLKQRSDLTEKVELSIARLFARLGKYDQAMEILRRSLRQGSGADTRYLLAVIMAQAEQYEQALDQLRMIGPDEEEFENAVILRVRLLRFLDRQEDAIELLEKTVANEETRSPDMFVMLAALYHVQHQTKKGEEAFERAMSAFPENNELLYEYGLFMDTAGQPDEALTIMEKLIEREPTHGEALNYVGYSWADKNIHLDKALEYIKRAIELKPENAFIQDSLGWVYYRLGRIEEAREALEYALELSDNDPTIYDHLGDVYLELGRTEDALEAYRKGLSLFEGDEKSELKDNIQEKLRLLESPDKE